MYYIIYTNNKGDIKMVEDVFVKIKLSALMNLYTMAKCCETYVDEQAKLTKENNELKKQIDDLKSSINKMRKSS